MKNRVTPGSKAKNLGKHRKYMNEDYYSEEFEDSEQSSNSLVPAINKTKTQTLEPNHKSKI